MEAKFEINFSHNFYSKIDKIKFTRLNLTLSSQNYDLLDLPHCISFNIEGIYHLIPKLTSNPQK